MNSPPQPVKASGGFNLQSNLNVHQPSQTSNVHTWDCYERFRIARYVSGGLSKGTARRFAQGEINAIQSGNHWTHGKPTPANPLYLLLQDLSPDEREQFTERAGILEYDGGMSRADAEALAIAAIISRNYPAPEPRTYRGSAAIKQIL